MFIPKDLEQYDFIFAMDVNNFENLLEYAHTEEHTKKIHLILTYAGLGQKRSVPDPYYQKLEEFEKVFFVA